MNATRAARVEKVLIGRVVKFKNCGFQQIGCKSKESTANYLMAVDQLCSYIGRCRRKYER
jgi:hypothetical protein